MNHLPENTHSKKEWNTFYSDNEVIVPYLDLCVFAVKRLKAAGPSRTVYGFGCGLGNNLKFIRSVFKDVRLLGSDVSEVAIKKLHDELIPNSKFWVNDERLNIPNMLDFVLERGSLQHVSKSQAKNYVTEIYNSMKIGAEGFFEIASTSHGLYNEIGDAGYDPTFGFRTFYSLDEIESLFSDFEIRKIYHLTRELVLDSKNEKNIFRNYTQGSFQVEIAKVR